MRAKLLFLILILCIINRPASAQHIQEWGDVSNEQWEINSFENDENAHSIILFDVGESYVDKNIEIIHKRHKRIKILNPDQSDYTEIKIPVYDDRSVQQLRNVSAQTINRGEDGEAVRIEVDKDNIFTENSDNWEITSFTFPALEPGSIVEYEYEIIFSNPAALPGWTFQHSSPTLHSEYRVLVPDFLEFSAYNYGYLPFEQTDDDNEHMNRMRRYYNLAPSLASYTFFRTVLKDAPAIRDEPYVTSLDNYKNQVKYQLAGYTNNEGLYRSYMSTWDEIADELLDSYSFGKSITTRRSLRKSTEEIVDGIDDDMEKARTIYNYVAENVQWNNKYRLSTTDRADKILEDLSGNSSDKAILLISMLRSAGLQADPVIVSTRSNGKVDWNYPTPRSFNHTTVLLRIEDTIFLLDPIDEIIPFGVLNPSSINGSGLLMGDESAQIVDITPDNLSSVRTASVLNLDNTGKLSVQLRSNYYGYDAIVHRYLAEQEDQQTYLEENHLENAPGSEIEDFELLNLDDSSKPFTVNADIVNEQYATVAGDMIYINPFFKERISKNPFSNPDRNFPVEFNYGTNKQVKTTLIIPEGYEIVEIPENSSVQFSEKAGFSFMHQVSGNTVQMLLVTVNNEIRVDTDRYEDLRNYYAFLTEFFNQQIVLRKSGDESDVLMENETGQSGN
jgi:transglutaminase-like putative cysteine protease